jgi:mannose-6-phosphate isomerase-like protein (cupin superfamily)
MLRRVSFLLLVLHCVFFPAPSLGQVENAASPSRVLSPKAGERLVYCEIPLVLTIKVDSASTPGTRLRASTGQLSKGSEFGVHRDADEVLYITQGHGWAIIAADTIAVEPGSVMFVPQGTQHGLINMNESPLEYFVVHTPQTSAAGFRRRASIPGPHCPSAKD